MSTIQLGDTVREKISGFTGVVTGLVRYITGCDQALVAPRTLKEEGTRRESEWFDIQRLDVDGTVPRLVLDNSRSPGPDKEAPKR